MACCGQATKFLKKAYYKRDSASSSTTDMSTNLIETILYVAWGIIKLDGNILFHQREDTQKRYEKNTGNYVLTHI